MCPFRISGGVGGLVPPQKKQTLAMFHFLSVEHLGLTGELCGDAFATLEVFEVVEAELSHHADGFGEGAFGVIYKGDDDGVVADPVAALCDIPDDFIGHAFRRCDGSHLTQTHFGAFDDAHVDDAPRISQEDASVFS